MITDHSATLIDNTCIYIFFNSFEHFTSSGNLIGDQIWETICLQSNFLIASKFSSLSDNIKIFRRHYSNLDEEVLIYNHIKSIDWVGQLSCYGWSWKQKFMFNTFYSIILKY